MNARRKRWPRRLTAALLLSALFVAPVVILIRPLTRRGWLVGLAAGAAWLIMWYVPVSLETGVLKGEKR